MRKRKRMRAAVTVMAAIILSTADGCGNGTNRDIPADSSSSAVQKYPVGSYERRAADNAALGIEEFDGEVIDFGSDSIFRGIQVETDENGEIICNRTDGALRYRVTDERFGTYGTFAGFVRKRSGEGEMGALSRYFTQEEEGLYFVIGAKERNVKEICRYYFDDASELTVTVAHASDSRHKSRAVRSEIHFVREDGVWKLDRLTVYRDQG